MNKNIENKRQLLFKTISKLGFVLFTIGLVLSFQLFYQAHAATILVDSTADNTTAGDSNCTLREAINNANDTTDGQTSGGDCTAGNPTGADTITFDASLDGTPITLDIGNSHDDTNASGDLDILDDLTLTGNGQTNTIIDGNNDKRIFEVVSGQGVTQFTLNSLTLQNADIVETADGRDGGAIFNDESGTTVTLNSVTLTGNVAATGTTADGGGLYSDGPVVINNSILTNNDASGNGGGISHRAGTISISDTTISGNNADFGVTSNRVGGGIQTGNNCTTMTIINSTISGNSAQRGGGIANGCSGVATLTNVTVSGNSVDVGSESPVLRSGGGIYHSTATTTTLRLNYSTVTNNSVTAVTTASGGGIETNNSASQIVFSNTIIFDNSVSGGDASIGPDCNDSSGFGTFTSGGYNLVGIGTGCPGGGTGDQTTGDAKLLALADNGGSTQTHALDTGSPALDQIPSGANDCGLGVTTDQRGELRPEAAGGDCDVGAYEAPAPPAPEIDVQGNGQSITNGSTTPSPADDTGYGTITLGDAPVTHTFTISNSGTADLSLTGTPNITLTTAAHFAVTAQPAASTVISGSTASFQVTFNPSSAGSFTDTVNIANNDSDEHPYTFVISGTANPAGTATTITADSPDPSTVGQSYTVTATVTSAAGTPTGTVDVDDGDANTCQITLASGAGSCSLTSTLAGTKTLTAAYNGAADFNPSSDTETHTVNNSTTTTITADSPDPSVVGQAYTVTATVTSAAGTPTGTLDVDDGDANTCQITLASGTGSCSLTSTSVGAKTLTAAYSGATDFNPSSDTEAHTVGLFDLAVDKSAASSTASPISTITYTISVQHLGTLVDAAGVVISDTLPLSLTLVTSATTNGSQYNPATGVWSVGSVAAGAGVTLTIVTTGSNLAGQAIVNTAVLTESSPSDSNGSNNSASATLFDTIPGYLPVILKQM